MNAWVIDKPELQTLGQKIIHTILTFALWIFWLYLWLPLLGPWQEELGIESLLASHMFNVEGYQYLVEMLIICGFASVFIAIILGSWAYYNKKVFGHNRRRRPSITNKAAIAHHFRVDQGNVELWHSSNCIRVTHDLDGNVDKVKIYDPFYQTGKPQPELHPLSLDEVYKDLFR